MSALSVAFSKSLTKSPPKQRTSSVQNQVGSYFTQKLNLNGIGAKKFSLADKSNKEKFPKAIPLRKNRLSLASEAEDERLDLMREITL